MKIPKNTKIPEPIKVLERRRKIEKKMLEIYAPTIEEFAEYFNTNPTVIRKDFKALKINPSQEKSYKIQTLRNTRDTKIKERIKNGEDVHKVLESYGLWRMPKNLEKEREDGEFLKDLSDRLFYEGEKKNRIVSLLELGWSNSDVYKYVDGVDKINRTALELYISKNKLSPKYIKEKDQEMNLVAGNTIKELYEKSLKENVPYTSFKNNEFKQILDLTGVSETKMFEAIGKDNYAQHRKNRIVSNNDKRLEKDQLKMEIYKKWINNEGTQEELSKEYNLSRGTIMNYIYDVKMDNLANLSNEISTMRRRNSNSEIKAKVKAKKERFLNKYYELENRQELSILEISRRTGFSFNDCQKFLLQEKLIDVSYKRSNLLKIEEATKLSKETYELGVKSFFGYGPNAGIAKRDNFSRDQSLQRETKYALKNEIDLRESFNENAWDILPYFLSVNEKAKEEYEEKNKRIKDYDDYEIDL